MTARLQSTKRRFVHQAYDWHAIKKIYYVQASVGLINAGQHIQIKPEGMTKDNAVDTAMCHKQQVLARVLLKAGCKPGYDAVANICKTFAALYPVVSYIQRTKVKFLRKTLDNLLACQALPPSKMYLSESRLSY